VGVGDQRRGLLGEVGAGVDEHLQRDRRCAGVPAGQREHGREVPAGAVSHDDEPRRGGRQVGCPSQAVKAVVHPGGEPVGGRQAVVDGDHLGAGMRGDRAAGPVVAVQVAEDPAASVQVDYAPTGRAPNGGVEPDAPVAAAPGDDPVGEVDPVGDRSEDSVPQPVVAGVGGLGLRDVGRAHAGDLAAGAASGEVGEADTQAGGHRRIMPADAVILVSHRRLTALATGHHRRQFVLPASVSFISFMPHTPPRWELADTTS